MFGREIPFRLIRSQIGKGGDQLLPVFFTEEELALFGKELEAYRAEHWKKNYLGYVKAFPGTRALFERIREDGILIVLASSAKEDEVEIYKRIAHIADLIDGETSASEVAHSKPYPDIVIAALEKIGVDSSSEVVVVGDSPFDAIAASQIGLRTIGVRSGGFPDEALWEAGVSEIFNGPQDLLERYERSMIGEPSHSHAVH